MKVQYVGKQEPHRERLYGTKTLFSGPGDVQEFDDKLGRKMVNNHPDQYAEEVEEAVEETTVVKQVSSVSDESETTPLIPLNPEAAAALVDHDDQENSEGEKSEGETTTADEIMFNGALTAIKDVSKDALIDTAKKAWGVDIPTRTLRDDVVDQVTKLIAERGQPQG